MRGWLPCDMCGGTGKTISRTELEPGGRMLRCPKCLGRPIFSRDFASPIIPEEPQPPRRLDPKFQRLLEKLDLRPDHGEPSQSREGLRPSQRTPRISNPKSRRQSSSGRMPPGGRPPNRRRGPRGWHPPRPSKTFLLLVIILCAAALMGFLLAIEPELRAELSEWVGRQLNPPETRLPGAPMPVAVAVEAPTIEPTPTPTPRADSVATIVAMTLMALPTKTPEPSATPNR